MFISLPVSSSVALVFSMSQGASTTSAPQCRSVQVKLTVHSEWSSDHS